MTSPPALEVQFQRKLHLARRGHGTKYRSRVAHWLNAGVKELLGTAVVFSELGSSDDIRVQGVTDAFREAAQRLRAAGKSDLVAFALNDAPAHYANGQRSLLQIRDEIAAEYTLIPIEALVEYFRAFEKAGVMALRKN